MPMIKKIIKNILQYEAQWVVRKYKPRVIVVVGSVGKTSTREMIYSIMAKRFFVRKSEKSYTADFGSALTIIGRPAEDHPGKYRKEIGAHFFRIIGWYFITIIYGVRILISKVRYPEWLVLEIDADKPGDLASASWLKPEICVMTAIGSIPTHVELFGEISKVEKEYADFLSSLSRDCRIISNADDPVSSKIVLADSHEHIFCGMGGGCQFSATDVSVLYGNTNGRSVPSGITFKIKSGESVESISIFNTVGSYAIYAALLSCAVGKELGFDLTECFNFLKSWKSLPGRMAVLSGISESSIIDDTYNSSPGALFQAVSDVASLNVSGKKIAVVGDMLELGKYSVSAHRDCADILSKSFNNIICVGIRSRDLAEALIDSGMEESRVISVDSPDDVVKNLNEMLTSGDCVFIKGSQDMRLEKVVAAILRHPQDAEKILVRQERSKFNK
jgi:UDP-N-acetylmuramoyl-tripeptide--D-alanyl-D-alanine ligase